MLEDLLINAEGDFKRPLGALGQNWEVGQTSFEDIETSGTVEVKSEFNGHKKVLGIVNGNLSYANTVAQSSGIFDVFATYQSPTSELYIVLKDGAAVNKGRLRFANGIISYYNETLTDWIACGFYNKIPTFYEKLADFESAFNERESMLLFKYKFEGKRSRDAYKILMQELEEAIKKYHEKNIKSE